MKETLNTYQIVDALMADEYAGWSRAGARALAESLERYEEETGEELELDVVAFRCEYNEFASASEAALEYGWDASAASRFAEFAGVPGRSQDDDDDEKEAAAVKWLQDRTTVITFDGGVIVSAF